MSQSLILQRFTLSAKQAKFLRSHLGWCGVLLGVVMFWVLPLLILATLAAWWAYHPSVEDATGVVLMLGMGWFLCFQARTIRLISKQNEDQLKKTANKTMEDTSS